MTNIKLAALLMQGAWGEKEIMIVYPDHLGRAIVAPIGEGMGLSPDGTTLYLFGVSDKAEFLGRDPRAPTPEEGARSRFRLIEGGRSDDTLPED